MSVLNKTMYRILFGLFLSAFVLMLLQPFTDTGFVEPISVVLLSFLLYLLFMRGFKKIKALSTRTIKKMIYIFFILFILLQILIVSQIQIQIFGDPWNTLTQALHLSKGIPGWDPWIEYYPNLLPYVGLQWFYIKIAEFLHLNYYIIFYSFNILINTSIWMSIIQFLWKKNPNIAGMTTVLMLILPMNYEFILKVGYTDGIAILMLVSLARVFDHMMMTQKLTYRSFFASIFCFTCAYLARPNVIVVLVALLIFVLFAFLKRDTFQKLWQHVLKLFLACVIGIILSIGLSQQMANWMHYDMNNPINFPTANWIYESVNFESMGEWTPQDRDYTLTHPGFATAKDADIAGIKNRISELLHHPWKIPVLYIVKFATLWSCGTFATATDYQLYSQMYHWSRAPRFVVDNIGTINIFIETYAKSLMALLLFAIVSQLKRVKKIELSIFDFSILTIMGISLFHTLLWEVKPRYQYMTIGLIIIAAALSFENLYQKQHIKRLENKLISKKRGVIVFGLCALSSLILMSTVMQMQAPQTIIVNSQFQQLDNYHPGEDQLILQAQEKIVQEINLPTSAEIFTVTSQPSQNIQLKIQKKLHQKWIPITQKEIPKNAVQTTVQQHFQSGKYRLILFNSNDTATQIKAMTHTEVLDYPNQAKIGSRKISLGFEFSKKEKVSKYHFGLILLFLVLYSVTIFLFYTEKSF